MSKIRIHYLGHASFILAFENDITLLTDYGESCAYGLDSPIHDFGDLRPCIVTYSHHHPDHDRGLKWEGIPVLSGENLDLGDVQIRAIPVRENQEQDNFGYLVCYQGLSIFHAGDAQGDMTGMDMHAACARLKGQLPDPLDLLMLPIGWKRDILSQAVDFLACLRPKRVIPMHYWSEAEKQSFFELLKAASTDYRFTEIQDGQSELTDQAAQDGIEVISLRAAPFRGWSEPVDRSDNRAGRKFLKSDRWDEWRQSEYDQKRGLPAPPQEKPAPPGSAWIDLPAPDSLGLGAIPLVDAIRHRRSRRSFSAQPLSLGELTFLLWATQGISGDKTSLRTVPSGGARHAFETYLFVRRVTSLETGLYRYLPLEHKLCLLRTDQEMPQKVARACKHAFAAECAVTFMWTVLPYRTEWRYSFLSPKLLALDAGHVCQNLYLACEAIGAGTCAIDAYDQNLLDDFLGVDGEEEFAIYVAPVGKLGPRE